MKTLVKLAVCLALLVHASRAVVLAEDLPGPLKSYVSQPDESYKWVKRQEGKIGAANWVELILTSQTWKGTVWRHQLFIIRPGELRDPEQGILLIDGGAWNDDLAKPPAAGQEGKLTPEASILAQVAARVKSPVAVLKQVPQQPIFDGLVEDAAISYTFDQFFKTRDATWPLLLPMVKSAVRGMDAVQEFAKAEWAINIKNFTLTGASKRGWTTWLTASVDPRVNAFAPMVIDMLNMGLQMKHQVATFGKFSEEIADYTNRGIQAHDDSEDGRLLRAIIDPYAYRKLLTQPKVILLGTNDRYWPLDALNLYWHDLVGEKHILYVPNNGHGLSDLARITGTIAALHRQAAGQMRLAKLSWTMVNDDGRLTMRVKSDTKPSKVSAWIATAESRDFRESKWDSHPAELVDGDYFYQLDVPQAGYAAMFGEAMFETDVLPYYLSTNVKIVTATEPGK
ncbi:MAG: PhoPQ-activated pathogenicity protein [Planctomycetia bacterium]|nr:PhoPQ-activated pathogenicity protein [Planctomycetia bacterium]